MPLYIYKNPQTGELIELVQSMKDEHVYFDENGLEWKRVFQSSQLNTQGSIDPWNSNDFVNKTGNTKGNYGDLIDRSRDLSEKRASENGGIDPVKEKYFKDYSKKRGGAIHPSQKIKKIQNKGFGINL